MTSDSLLSDDFAVLLRAFPSEALEGAVSLCKQYTSWSPFPADRAYDAHKLSGGADFTPHAENIARELICSAATPAISAWMRCPLGSR